MMKMLLFCVCCLKLCDGWLDKDKRADHVLRFLAIVHHHRCAVEGNFEVEE